MIYMFDQPVKVLSNSSTGTAPKAGTFAEANWIMFAFLILMSAQFISQ